ncbi:hypothetical protein ACT4BE_004537, partial [Shigella flexneri]
QRPDSIENASGVHQDSVPEINFFANHKVHLMSLALAGLLYVRSKPRIAARNNPESFRKLSLRTAV